MSIYDVDGAELFSAYSVNGNNVSILFNVDGEEIFPSTLKVGTYNVGSWYDGSHDNVPSAKDAEYYALQTEILQKNNFDILVLEEYTKQFSKTGRTAKSVLDPFFPYIREQGGDVVTNTYGRCICSKYPISNYTVRNYSSGTSNYFDSCNVTVGNVVFTVFVTHLHWSNTYPDSTREAQVAQLISTASQYQNVIIGGDFNTGISKNHTDEENKERYDDFVKPFVDNGFNSANFSDFGDFVTCIDSNSTEYYLDNIYTSSNISITDSYVDETKKNDLLNDTIDHMPLVAIVEVTA